MSSINSIDLKKEAEHALSIVFKKTLDEEEQNKIMNETIKYWKENVNEGIYLLIHSFLYLFTHLFTLIKGFLSYRKSVSNESSYAALDWIDAYPGTSWFQCHKGEKYLDLLGGYGIYNVGRRHPKVTEAVSSQLAKQALHSQELLDPLRSYTAHLLSLITPRDEKRVLRKCFFTNSGTESVEACLKIAFMSTGRSKVLATINAFHGKTLGALACTSKAKFRGPFINVLAETSHVLFNNIVALQCAFESAEATGNRFACFIIEPIQGEGGIHVATKEYLQKARELCDMYGTLLIFDEVQSGMGRTGKWWACQHADVCPDLLAIGKSFGGGVMPAGACIGTDEVWQKYVDDPFLLTTTFGGNPLALSASLACINVIIEENLIDKARDNGAYFINKLKEIQAKYPSVLREVRGTGMMIGIEFMTNEYGVIFSKKMFENHILVAGTLANAQTIRIEPALTITTEDVSYACNICEKVIADIAATLEADMKPPSPITVISLSSSSDISEEAKLITDLIVEVESIAVVDMV